MSLKGKVAIITGSTKGIGRAAAVRLGKDGASIVINHRSDPAGAEALAKEIGNDSIAVKADVSKIDEIENLVKQTVDKYGKIDFLINNAAVMKMRDLANATEADFDQHFNTNVKGVLFLTQKAAPHIPAGGRIINFSTGVNIWTSITPQYLLYAATKGAIDQMTRALSKDLGTKGISVNAVAPGPTATELFFEGKPQAVIDHIKSMSPFNRLGTPEEIAGVIAMLCSGETQWISGQVIRVTGANQV